MSILQKYNLNPGSFEILPISGFVNTRIPEVPNCEDIRIQDQQLAVSNSVYLYDDLRDVAKNIVHPMVDYSGQSQGLTFEETVDQTWGRMAGSSVWLEKYGVYLLVSRVFFYPRGVKSWSAISFIRAQIYDEDWNHLDDYKLTWNDETIRFPQTLNITAPYELGGVWFGPEDPRIVIEPDYLDAEPIIVFNMVDNTTSSVPSRSMYIHRPFSHRTRKLVIENRPPRYEKNWSPFFMPDMSTSSSTKGQHATKSIYFVYDWNDDPDIFSILRCDLEDGSCQFVFRYDQPDMHAGLYLEAHNYGSLEGDIRGGTNFVPVPFETRPGFVSFVGFPRSHVENVCGQDAIYRPFLMLLVTNSTHFFLDYASAALDFRQSILTEAQYSDHCGDGRILIANGIARFDDRIGNDVMTMTVTIADSTVQVVRLYGVRALIANLPQLRSKTSTERADLSWKLNVTHDLLRCSTLSATEFALRYAGAELAERLKFGQLTEAEKQRGNRPIDAI